LPCLRDRTARFGFVRQRDRIFKVQNHGISATLQGFVKAVWAVTGHK
jgi:hypothetical protein